ncbi:hypothetical protein SeLEV6574_g04430 [Synchytrium endobioticum]|nr:hypothetical protein SeLEV6574_g04430 [Synchytrium endobioticum]
MPSIERLSAESHVSALKKTTNLSSPSLTCSHTNNNAANMTGPLADGNTLRNQPNDVAHHLDEASSSDELAVDSSAAKTPVSSTGNNTTPVLIKACPNANATSQAESDDDDDDEDEDQGLTLKVDRAHKDTHNPTTKLPQKDHDHRESNVNSSLHIPPAQPYQVRKVVRRGGSFGRPKDLEALAARDSQTAADADAFAATSSPPSSSTVQAHHQTQSQQPQQHYYGGGFVIDSPSLSVKRTSSAQPCSAMANSPIPQIQNPIQQPMRPLISQRQPAYTPLDPYAGYMQQPNQPLVRGTSRENLAKAAMGLQYAATAAVTAGAGISAQQQALLQNALEFYNQQQQLALAKLNAHDVVTKSGGTAAPNLNTVIDTRQLPPHIPDPPNPNANANPHPAARQSSLQPPKSSSNLMNNPLPDLYGTNPNVSTSSALYPQDTSMAQQPPLVAPPTQPPVTQRRTSTGRPVHLARPGGSTSVALAAQQHQLLLQQLPPNQNQHPQPTQQADGRNPSNTQRPSSKKSNRSQNHVPPYLKNVKVIRGGFGTSNTYVPATDGSLHHSTSMVSLSSSIRNMLLNPATTISHSLGSNAQEGTLSTIHPSNQVHPQGGIPMFPRPPTGSVISMSLHGGRMRTKEVTMQYFGLGKPLPLHTSPVPNNRNLNSGNSRPPQQAPIPSRVVSDQEDFDRGDFLESANGSGPSIALSRSNLNATGLGLAPHRQHWKPDASTNQCKACHCPFTFYRRRHHCRMCGEIFCHACSTNCARLTGKCQPHAHGILCPFKAILINARDF